MALKAVREKVDQAWTWTKKLLVLMSVWGLIFSVATISRLAVAFDFDDTLVFSGPAYEKALANSAQAYSPQYWSVVNRSYDLETPKIIPWAMAWVFRICGFRVSVLSSRPPVDSDGLKKEWRHLIAKGRFIFVPSKESKHEVLKDGNYLLFFGDSDTDIAQARLARVTPVRIRRSPKSVFKDDYNPGGMGEVVIPLSEF